MLYTDFLPALAAKGLALFLIDEVRGTDLYAAGSLSGLRVGCAGCFWLSGTFAGTVSY
ncbi:hypothetical protein [Pseudomonas weihenstephanensis]|uniref:hypothetical protein n=1 Tax=Pseudomonas weihenstephanensis TaxID=1608994 RepID=UPI001301296D|nr:hypothetical protein [Pseudomonas weihenstephanensis]